MLRRPKNQPLFRPVPERRVWEMTVRVTDSVDPTTRPSVSPY